MNDPLVYNTKHIVCFFHFKVDPNEAVTCLMKAIEIYTDMGRFTMAAKHHQTIAEMYENEANDLVSLCGRIWYIEWTIIFNCSCLATSRSAL